jgi:hypothetical protein
MLRTLVRDKANLVAESGDWLRRMQKSLDQMNVRVHRAVSNIDGVTGMAILRAIAGGERVPNSAIRVNSGVVAPKWAISRPAPSKVGAHTQWRSLPRSIPATFRRITGKP